jgi:hypothetical protein
MYQPEVCPAALAFMIASIDLLGFVGQHDEVDGPIPIPIVLLVLR